MSKFVYGKDINIMKPILYIPFAITGLLVLLSMSSFRHDIKGEGESVKWMTFEQAVEQSKTEKRKIFIDVYTDWCGWCKVMDKNTFSDPAVAKLLNEKFYAVKLNAEQREDIRYNGTTFKFIENGRSGYHQLAAALLNNQLSFPTVVFLDEEFAILQPLPGYRKAPEFHQIAQFYGEGHYKTEKWEDFQKNSYKSPY
jgi:thioredoxin-related protein